jgi:two-component system, response regulator PdtaR
MRPKLSSSARTRGGAVASFWRNVNARSRVALQALLHQTGYHVLEAGNAADAIDHLYRSVRPDVILLDLRLPDKGGVQLAAELQANSLFREIPIIVISGFLDSEALPCGVVATFEKPVDTGALLHALARTS